MLLARCIMLHNTSIHGQIEQVVAAAVLTKKLVLKKILALAGARCACPRQGEGAGNAPWTAFNCGDQELAHGDVHTWYILVLEILFFVSL